MSIQDENTEQDQLPSTRDAARGAPKQRRNVAFVALCLGFFAVILDVTIVNVALPAIQNAYGSTITDLQWVANGYNLVFAALLLTAGAICDRRGGLRVFVLGIAIFALGSLWCGISPSLGLLVAGRLVQGLGAALLLPASLMLISHSYPAPAERTRAVAAWAAVGGAATAAGPVLGGVLVDTVGWRAIFLVNLPVAAIAIALLLRYGAESSTRSRGLDLLGQFLGIALLAAAAAAITESGPLGWSSPFVVAMAVVAIAAVILFTLVEQRSPEPMLPPGLLRHRTFTAATVTGLLLNFGIYGQVFVLSLYFQHDRGYSALLTGLALLPFAGVTVIGPPVTGRITARLGPRPVMVFGQVVAACGTLVLALGGHTTPYGTLVVGLFLLGVGFAATMPSMTAAVVLASPQEYAGIASGVLNASRQVGGVLGVALLGSLVSDPRHFLPEMHTSLGIVTGTFLAGAVLSLTFVRRVVRQPVQRERAGEVALTATPLASNDPLR